MILVLCSGVDDVAIVCGFEVVAVVFVIVGVVDIFDVVVIVVVAIVVVDVDNVAAADDIVLLAAFCTPISFVGV